MNIYKPEDFSFIPESERDMVARQFNIGAEAACHTTENTGSWEIPPFDKVAAKQLFEATIK